MATPQQFLISNCCTEAPARAKCVVCISLRSLNLDISTTPYSNSLTTLSQRALNGILAVYLRAWSYDYNENHKANPSSMPSSFFHQVVHLYQVSILKSDCSISLIALSLSLLNFDWILVHHIWLCVSHC
jgi:hypothetical protein